MKRFRDEYDDMSDGAFFALAEQDFDIDYDDWIEFDDKEREIKK